MSTRTFVIVLIAVAALVGAAAYLHAPRGEAAHFLVSPVHGGR